MDYSIFYSWQTDAPADCNRRLIRDAVEKAVANINSGIQVHDAPRVDSGMEGVGGSPEVASIMFDKIGESAIFLGDVTLVGNIEQHGGEVKKTLNPNVAIEMGYAAGALGWGRIVCVMNESFGKREEQPFDVRNRRFPINYSFSLEDVADIKKKAKVTLDLAKDIQNAIIAVEATDLRKVNRAIQRLDVRCLNMMTVYGKGDYFSEPQGPNQLVKDLERINSSAVRLIEIGLLRAEVSSDRKLYAYHWTYVGKKVLEKLGFRHV